MGSTDAEETNNSSRAAVPDLDPGTSKEKKILKR